MSKQDDVDREDGADTADDEDRDSDAPDSEPESEPEPQRSTKARPASATRGAPASAKTAARPGSGLVTGRTGLIAVVALALGGAAGWFAHDAHAKAELRKESAPAPAGSGAPAGPCGVWQQKICTSSGEQSAACQQAKDATDLLTPSTCEVALETVPATLTKLKAGRASCDKLVGKLCKDLPQGSKACDLVKARTPSFPSSRCEQMLEKYDQVLAELNMLDQQMGQAPMGGPHGAPPAGMPPAGMPPPSP